MRGSEVVAGVPKPAAIGAVERMAFVGGWKAQGRDSHALVHGARTDERRGSQALRAMVVGRKMNNEPSKYLSA